MFTKWRSKQPLMDEHAFPPTGFAVALARLFVTFGGIMTTAGQGLPYPCSLQAKTRNESSRRGKASLPWYKTLVQRISGI